MISAAQANPAVTHPVTFADADAPVARVQRLPGRARSFGLGFLLGVVTVGVYYLWWQYAAFREVDLESGRPHRWPLFAGFGVSMLAAWLAAIDPVAHPATHAFTIAGFALWAAYIAAEVRQLALARKAIGLDPGYPGFLFALVGIDFALSVVGEVLGLLWPALISVPLLVVVFMTAQVRMSEYWNRLQATTGRPQARRPFAP